MGDPVKCGWEIQQGEGISMRRKTHPPVIRTSQMMCAVFAILSDHWTVLQASTSTYPTITATRLYRSMRRIACTAKLATSRTLYKTSSGRFRKEEGVRRTRSCRVPVPQGSGKPGCWSLPCQDTRPWASLLGGCTVVPELPLPGGRISVLYCIGGVVRYSTMTPLPVDWRN
jgi:hypothetical protein